MQHFTSIELSDGIRRAFVAETVSQIERELNAAPIDPAFVSKVAMLGDRAKRDGIRILTAPDGSTFATSSSDSGKIYQVTPTSCDCPSFSFRGVCKHLVALHQHNAKQ